MNYFKICDNLDQCLSRLSGNPKLAVAISRERAYNSLLILASQIYCFDSEIIYEFDLKFLVNKNSTILTDLNEFIQSAIESGLIKKWRFDNQMIKLPCKYIQKVYGQLNLEHHFGMIIIWGLMITFVFFVFLLERVVYRKVRSSNAARYLKFIEIAIDGERHFWLETKWK